MRAENGSRRWLISRDGGTVELLLLNGSAKDVAPNKVLDLQDDPSLRRIDQEFIEYRYKQFKSLLRQARARCPNAVIIVPGYFSPLAHVSNRLILEILF